MAMDYTDMGIIADSYARTSGESGDSVSLDSQLKANRRFAENAGITIAREYKEEYTGTKVSRPKFNEIVARIEQGRVNAIIIYASDRLARSESVAFHIIDNILLANGARLFIAYSAREIDLTNPETKMHFGMESLFSAYEVSSP